MHAYVLLPNHYHLLVQTPEGNLGRFMQALQTRYGVYFNRKYRKRGHVYEGPYRAVLVEEDAYLLKLSRYVHLNPVRTVEYKDRPAQEVIKALRGYRWSSYRGYVGLEKRKEWLTYEVLEEQVKAWFGKQRGGYRKYVESGLVEDDEELKEAMGSGGWVLGSVEFMADMKERYQRCVESGIRKREDISFAKERRSLGSEEILDVVAGGLRIGREDLMHRRGGGEYRGIAGRMLVKYGGLTQREAAEVLGVTTGAAISRQQKALEESLRRNRSLARRVQGIDSALARL